MGSECKNAQIALKLGLVRGLGLIRANPKGFVQKFCVGRYMRDPKYPRPATFVVECMREFKKKLIYCCACTAYDKSSYVLTVFSAGQPRAATVLLAPVFTTNSNDCVFKPVPQYRYECSDVY